MGAEPDNLISIEKFRIFENYGGSAGNYEHTKSKHEKVLSYELFCLIDRLVQDIKLVQKGLAAPSYEEQLSKTIEENCDNVETIRHLKTLAEKM